VFGSESRGLPPELHAEFGDERRLRIPMRPDNRSLNLSNAAAVVVYEAWRQSGFAGGA
jgi:tRNA (cytidine/uridine-2'-O-)-methyltransferase